MEDIKKRLIKLLEPRGTMALISKQAAIPKTTLYGWKDLNRKNLPNIEEGYRIAQVLNVSLDYLVTGVEPEVQYEKYDDLTEDIIAMVKDLSMEAKLELRGVIRKFIKDYREDFEAKGGTA